MTTVGVIGVGFFGYLGLKLQVKNSTKKIQDVVSDLEVVNTDQHVYNSTILYKILHKLSEHGALLETVVDTQTVPVITTDAEGGLVKINSAGLSLLGLSLVDLQGSGWVKAIHPDDRERVFSLWTESVRTKTKYGPVSYRYVNPNTGEVTMVEAMATPVVNPSTDELQSWVAVVQKIDVLQPSN